LTGLSHNLLDRLDTSILHLGIMGFQQIVLIVIIPISMSNAIRLQSLLACVV